MGVDQARKNVAVFGLDDLDAGRGRNRRADLDNLSFSNQDVSRFENTLLRHGVDAPSLDEEVLR